MSFVERDVELEVAGDICRAWFLVPEPARGPVSCIVMGHGFGLTRRCGLREVASELARGGHAVVLFDYRRFGDSTGRPRQVVSFRAQRKDWNAAVAFARAQPEVDAERICAWGFSLGAGHALSVAARDRGVAAVVAVAPMFDGLSSTVAALKGRSPADLFRLVSRGTLDWVGGLWGGYPITVPLTAPPGEMGLLTSHDVHRELRALVPHDFEAEIAARVALVFWTYLPGRLLRRLRRAVLVVATKADAVNPPGPTLRRARRCDRATVVELDCGHLEVMREPYRSRVVALTLEFLSGHALSRQVD